MASALALAASLLVVAVGSVPGAPSPPHNSGDVWGETETALDLYARTGAAGGSAATMAHMAQAALAFTAGFSDHDVAMVADLERALAPVVDAHRTGMTDFYRQYGIDWPSDMLDRPDRLDAMASYAGGPSGADVRSAAASEQLAFGEAVVRMATGPEPTTADATSAMLGAQPRAEPRNTLPALRSFGTLAEAAEALYAWYDADVEAEALDRLATVPDGTGRPLAAVIAAHLLHAEATAKVFAGLDAVLLQAAAESPGRESLQEAAGDMDLGLLLDARDVSLRILVEASSNLACVPDGPTEYGSATFQFDLACEDSIYGVDAALVVDLGGHDRYLNNAGGGQNASATLLDLSGDDVYEPIGTEARATIGSGYLGSGILLEVQGNDSYNDTTGTDGAVIGAGSSGAGTLVDLAGDDDYTGTISGDGAAIGAGSFGGVGTLIDQAGDDEYTGTIHSFGATIGASHNAVDVAGANGGVGTLIDRTGNDTFTAFVSGSSAAIGASHGGGTGTLVDVSGHDVYVATSASGFMIGAGSLGVGTLIDGAGHDSYRSEGGNAIAVGSRSGIGTVLDMAGDDAYVGNGSFTIGAASFGARGILIDQAGDDTYNSTGGVTMGAGVRGSIGAIVDHGGDETYTVVSDRNGIAMGAGNQGVGMLVDRAGNDTYVGTLTDDNTSHGSQLVMGAGYLGVGILIDAAGSDTFTATLKDIDGAALGAGVSGVGILLSAGDEVVFELAEGTGQGSGILGVGLLERTNLAGVTTYRAGVGARPGLQRGGGIGMLFDFGIISAESSVPDPACMDEAFVDESFDLQALTWNLRICPPHPSTAQPIEDPYFGEPITVPKPLDPDPEQEPGTVWKPPVPCSSAPGCQAASEQLPGEGWSRWLEAEYVNATVDGGLRLIFWQQFAANQADGPTLTARITQHRFDDTPPCYPSCLQGYVP